MYCLRVLFFCIFSRYTYIARQSKSISQLCIRNLKAGIGNQNKKISYRNLGAEMQRWTSKGCCWVRQMNARSWIDCHFPHRFRARCMIARPMGISCMRLIKGMAHSQRKFYSSRSFRITYPLLCVILLLL